MKEVITAATCLTCGACCVSYYDQNAFCDVEPADEVRLDKKFVRLHVLRARPIDRLAMRIDGSHGTEAAIATKWRKVTSGPLKGVEVCACVALRGSVMSNVKCSVYEVRPSVCRKAVKPGDKTCREIRHQVLNAIDGDDVR